MLKSLKAHPGDVRIPAEPGQDTLLRPYRWHMQYTGKSDCPGQWQKAPPAALLQAPFP